VLAVPIPYGRQTIGEDDIAAVVGVLRGDWLTQGPEVAAFEGDFATACDATYAVAFSSGTAALHGAAFAAGVGPGDELVSSALTFAASANCGAYLGATPRFADIETATWNVSPETVHAVLTPKTRALVAVDFAGLPVDLPALREAIGTEVTIIEDAAHALGASVEGVPVGSCQTADMSVFSFHPVKAITSGEGGMVTTRSAALRDKLTLFRSHGITKDADLLELSDEGGWHQEQHALGFNYRLTDLQSALGRSQLRKLDSFVERRNEIARRYREALAEIDEIELPPEAPPGTVHAYHIFVIRLRDGAAARRRLYDGLRERDIYPQVHYRPVHLHPWYRKTYGTAAGLAPVAENVYAGCLSLPCFPTLTDGEQQSVVDAIREVLAG
jgi:perosamine synthetase